VIVGGTIPGPDADALREQGVAAVFTPGTSTTAIVEYLQAHAATG
jgi:methylmalonyl-CoA mutase C-terminal domain/subunit